MVFVADPGNFNRLFLKFGNSVNFAAGQVLQAQVKLAPAGGRPGKISCAVPRNRAVHFTKIRRFKSALARNTMYAELVWCGTIFDKVTKKSRNDWQIIGSGVLCRSSSLCFCVNVAFKVLLIIFSKQVCATPCNRRKCRTWVFRKSAG